MQINLLKPRPHFFSQWNFLIQPSCSLRLVELFRLQSWKEKKLCSPAIKLLFFATPRLNTSYTLYLNKVGINTFKNVWPLLAMPFIFLNGLRFFKCFLPWVATRTKFGERQHFLSLIMASRFLFRNNNILACKLDTVVSIHEMRMVFANPLWFKYVSSHQSANLLNLKCLLFLYSYQQAFNFCSLMLFFFLPVASVLFLDLNHKNARINQTYILKIHYNDDIFTFSGLTWTFICILKLSTILKIGQLIILAYGVSVWINTGGLPHSTKHFGNSEIVVIVVAKDIIFLFWNDNSW